VESGSVLLEDCVEMSLGGRVGYATDLALLARDPGAARASLAESEIEVLAELTSAGLEELSALVPELRDVAGRVDGELRFGGTVGAAVGTDDRVNLKIYYPALYGDSAEERNSGLVPADRVAAPYPVVVLLPGINLAGDSSAWLASKQLNLRICLPQWVKQRSKY